MSNAYRDYTEVEFNLKVDGVKTNFSYLGKTISSLKIEDPVSLDGNPSSVGPSGSISLVDDGSEVFRILMKRSLDVASGTASISIPFDMTVRCWTGKRKFQGYVQDWSMSFSGGSVVYELKWNTYGQSAIGKSDRMNPISCKTPNDFIELLMSASSEDGTPWFNVAYSSGTSSLYSMDFIWKHEPDSESNLTKYTFRSKEDTLKSVQIFCSDVMSNNNDVAYTIDGSTNPPTIVFKEVSNTHNDSPSLNNEDPGQDISVSDVVFMYNGCPNLYGSIMKGKLVVPIDRLSFSTNMGVSTAIYKVYDGLNGAIAVNGSNAANEGKTSDNMSDKAAKINAPKRAYPLSLNMTVYNCMFFASSNVMSRVDVVVYDGVGRLHFISSDQYYVKSVSYSLSSAVISADVVLSMEM